jgi:hypothetical protein
LARSRAESDPQEVREDTSVRGLDFKNGTFDANEL